MPIGWIIVAVLAAIAVSVLLWAAWRWLAASWEVLDDDQLAERLAPSGASHTPVLWLLVRGWFGRGPRKLTYRRDERGRFRRTRR
jgi:hypothetical protein